MLPTVSALHGQQTRCMDDCSANALKSLRCTRPTMTPIWERGLAPSFSSMLKPKPVVGSNFAMVAPPSVPEVPPPPEFVPQLEAAIRGSRSSTKRRRIKLPKVSPNIDEERETEVKKWKSIIEAAGPGASGLAIDLQKMTDEKEQWTNLLAVFHGRAPSTLRKHAGAINMYIRWATTAAAPPFPFSELVVWNYVAFLQETRAPATRADSFIKAGEMAVDCLAMYCGNRELTSRSIDGAVKQSLDRKRETHRAPPLSVAAVEALERAISNERLHRTRIIVAGFARFCVGVRIRHSDATRVTTEPFLDPKELVNQRE